MSKRKSVKYIFTLPGINTTVVNEKYGINMISNIVENETAPNNTTKITELHTESPRDELISFLDESKRNHTCKISMIDFNTNKSPETLRYDCFWCKHPFKTQGIGCPTKYVSSQAVKTYHSDISKDVYTIKENITPLRRKSLGDQRIAVKIAEYYETDGVFCSFNCCQAWIDDNKHNKMYNQSSYLLMKIYKSITHAEIKSIISAPHWRLLENYGGNLTINNFRENFNKIDYEYQGISKLPKFFPLSTLFEEKIKF